MSAVPEPVVVVHEELHAAPFAAENRSVKSVFDGAVDDLFGQRQGRRAQGGDQEGQTFHSCSGRMLLNGRLRRTRRGFRRGEFERLT